MDVEPIVFWDGEHPSPVEQLARWKAESQFEEGKHGEVRIGHNGSSGVGVVDHVLAPLGLDPGTVAFTDAVPWFFVKYGKGSQGHAMATRFAPVGKQFGVDPGSLPRRPSPSQLVEIARSPDRRAGLRTEVLESDAPLVVTLGQEALDAIRAVADEAGVVSDRLSPDRYGKRGRLVIDAHSYALLPLVHPGFRRQTTNPQWKEALEAFDAALGPEKYS